MSQKWGVGWGKSQAKFWQCQDFESAYFLIPSLTWAMRKTGTWVLLLAKGGALGKHSYAKTCNAFAIVTVSLSPYWRVDLSVYTIQSVAKKGKHVIQISQRKVSLPRIPNSHSCCWYLWLCMCEFNMLYSNHLLPSTFAGLANLYCNSEINAVQSKTLLSGIHAGLHTQWNYSHWVKVQFYISWTLEKGSKKSRSSVLLNMCWWSSFNLIWWFNFV